MRESDAQPFDWTMLPMNSDARQRVSWIDSRPQMIGDDLDADKLALSWTRLRLRSCHYLRYRFTLQTCKADAVLTSTMPVTCNVTV